MRKFLCLSVASLCFLSLGAEDNATTNLPPDPFGELEAIPKAAEYEMEVDRSRGSFAIEAADGNYQAGSHFANWFWTTKVERPGNYFVGLLYSSARPKLGVQIKVGEDAVLKGYAPRTNELKEREPMILGTAYLAKPGEYPISMLTGDQSNVPAFQVRGVHFRPAPEGEVYGQSIDGSITLEAKNATTYSEKMRYEPEPEKNCLGFWAIKEDWAEWVFEVSTPGEFELKVTYGCGNGNEGSEVAVLVNDQTKTFLVEDTGGFQEWKEISLGTVALPIMGQNKIAILPQSQAAKGIMDIQRISLTPNASE